jgi:hypothetical protein
MQKEITYHFTEAELAEMINESLGARGVVWPYHWEIRLGPDLESNCYNNVIVTGLTVVCKETVE